MKIFSLKPMFTGHVILFTETWQVLGWNTAKRIFEEKCKAKTHQLKLTENNDFF